MRTTAQIAWVAAMIEAEGCIVATSYQYQKPGRGHYQARCFRLAIEMTDLDVVLRIRDILGPLCTVRERKPPSVNPNHRRRYILQFTGNELAGWLMTIYPFMGQRRRAKIRQALKLWHEMKACWRYARLPETALRIVS